MSKAAETAKREELEPVSDENRVMRLWRYIPAWWAAMIVVMIFAVDFLAIHQ